MSIYVQWSDKFKSGIYFIDQQHIQLINLINEFYYMEVAQNVKGALRALDQFIDFAYIHFSTEEWYFKKFDYPEKWNHIREHRAISNKLSKIYDNINNSGFHEDVMPVLKDWFTNHFLTTDKVAANFLASKLKEKENL